MHKWIDTALEAYICLILTIEYFYDMFWNTREQRAKRRKRQKPQFESITIGEGK